MSSRLGILVAKRTPRGIPRNVTVSSARAWSSAENPRCARNFSLAMSQACCEPSMAPRAHLISLGKTLSRSARRGTPFLRSRPSEFSRTISMRAFVEWPNSLFQSSPQNFQKQIEVMHLQGPLPSHVKPLPICHNLSHVRAPRIAVYLTHEGLTPCHLKSAQVCSYLWRWCSSSSMEPESSPARRFVIWIWRFISKPRNCWAAFTFGMALVAIMLQIERYTLANVFTIVSAVSACIALSQLKCLRRPVRTNKKKVRYKASRLLQCVVCVPVLLLTSFVVYTVWTSTTMPS